MNILFLRRYGGGTVAAPRHYHAFEQQVGEYTNCRWAGVGWPLYRLDEPFEVTVERVMPDVDWVIDRERDTPLPHDRDYKAACYLSDIHGRGAFDVRGAHLYIKSVNDVGYDTVFMRYRYLYGEKTPPEIFSDNLEAPTCFLPWSVDGEEFQPSKTKRFDVAFIGSLSSRYPLRMELNNNLTVFCRDRKLKLLFKVRVAGMRSFTQQKDVINPDLYFGSRYSNALARTRFFMFGCSIYRYPLLKYFEGMASGCVVMANEPSSAEELGFIDGETYVKINRGNWRDKLDYYLENPDEAAMIAGNARKLILERHTHKVRAEQFISYLRRFE